MIKDIKHYYRKTMEKGKSMLSLNELIDSMKDCTIVGRSKRVIAHEL
jgi:hypothetical protein